MFLVPEAVAGGGVTSDTGQANKGAPHQTGFVPKTEWTMERMATPSQKAADVRIKICDKALLPGQGAVH